jgi:hypothetical protein
MNPQGVSELHSWLTEAGPAGKSETMLLDGFCQRALDAGCQSPRRPFGVRRTIGGT